MLDAISTLLCSRDIWGACKHQAPRYGTLCNTENTDRLLGREQRHRRRELRMRQAMYLMLALFQHKDFPYQRTRWRQALPGTLCTGWLVSFPDWCPFQNLGMWCDLKTGSLLIQSKLRWGHTRIEWTLLSPIWHRWVRGRRPQDRWRLKGYPNKATNAKDWQSPGRRGDALHSASLTRIPCNRVAEAPRSMLTLTTCLVNTFQLGTTNFFFFLLCAIPSISESPWISLYVRAEWISQPPFLRLLFMTLTHLREMGITRDQWINETAGVWLKSGLVFNNCCLKYSECFLKSETTLDLNQDQ